MHRLGRRPPAEAEAQYYAHLQASLKSRRAHVGSPEAIHAEAVLDDLPSLGDAEHSFAPAGVWSKCGGEVDFDELAGESEPGHA